MFSMLVIFCFLAGAWPVWFAKAKLLLTWFLASPFAASMELAQLALNVDQHLYEEWSPPYGPTSSTAWFQIATVINEDAQLFPSSDVSEELSLRGLPHLTWNVTRLGPAVVTSGTALATTFVICSIAACLFVLVMLACCSLTVR